MGESKKEKKSRKEKKLEKKLEEEKIKAKEYLKQLQYLKADFENYKKRISREKEESRKYATEQLVKDLLEVIDNMERAILAASQGESGGENLLKGIEITHKQLLKILEKEGVNCIQVTGEIFDPYKHECVMTENNEELDDDAITQELLKGYTMNSRVIRHSKVKINKR